MLLFGSILDALLHIWRILGSQLTPAKSEVKSSFRSVRGDERAVGGLAGRMEI